MHQRGKKHSVPFLGSDRCRILQAAEREQRARAGLQEAFRRFNAKREFGCEHRRQQAQNSEREWGKARDIDNGRSGLGRSAR